MPRVYIYACFSSLQIRYWSRAWAAIWRYAPIIRLNIPWGHIWLENNSKSLPAPFHQLEAVHSRESAAVWVLLRAVALLTSNLQVARENPAGAAKMAFTSEDIWLVTISARVSPQSHDSHHLIITWSTDPALLEVRLRVEYVKKKKKKTKGGRMDWAVGARRGVGQS
jgi:hypothetical protein